MHASCWERFRLLAPCVLALAGCNPWYVVESEYRGTTLNEQPPEIVETTVYRSVVRPGISVAVSAPDKCADQSAAQTTGGPKAAGELLATVCGVEMAELERGLVHAGFRVVSWNAIRQMVLYEQNVTPLEAAQALGATVLFQVNSLERSTVKPGGQLQWERRFYNWDLNFFQWFFGAGGHGSQGGLASVPEERAQALERGMQRLEATAKPREQISVTANATAILVGTGEAIWFYSWTHSERFEGQVMTSQLFECHRRHLSHCIPQQPATPDVAAGPPRSGSKGTAQSEPQDASPADAAYYQLVREVAADLVDRFAKG